MVPFRTGLVYCLGWTVAGHIWHEISKCLRLVLSKLQLYVILNLDHVNQSCSAGSWKTGDHNVWWLILSSLSTTFGKLTYWWSKGSWCGGRDLPTCFSPFDSTWSNHWWSRWYFRYYANTKHKNLGNVSFPMLLLVDGAISSLFVQQYTLVFLVFTCHWSSQFCSYHFEVHFRRPSVKDRHPNYG